MTFFEAKEKRSATKMNRDEWRIEEHKKRRFLYFGKRQAYEIITIEQEDLVLADPVKGDKIFFAKMPGWNRRIEPVINHVRHIHPEAEQSKRDQS